MVEKLKHVSESTLLELKNSIQSNLSRYKGGGFEEYAGQYLWDIGLSIDYDRDLLSKLDLTRQRNIIEIDLRNSKIIGEALSELTPSLANEELIWVRLSHIEAFKYSQARWLYKSVDDKTMISSIKKHMFASNQTAIRDDHAVSRLWWNFYIAKTSMPNSTDGALELILKTADIRSNFVERIWMTSRRPIAGGVLRAMKTRPELTASESNFREFMKVINRNGGGVVFEALDEKEIDTFIDDCCKQILK